MIFLCFENEGNTEKRRKGVYAVPVCLIVIDVCYADAIHSFIHLLDFLLIEKRHRMRDIGGSIKACKVVVGSLRPIPLL